MPPYNLLNPHFSNEFLFKRLMSRKVRSSGSNLLRSMRGQKEQVAGYFENTQTQTTSPVEAAHRISNYNGTMEEAALVRDDNEDTVTNSLKSIISSTTMKSVAKSNESEEDNGSGGVGGSIQGAVNFFEEMEKPVEDMMKTVSNKTNIPFFAVFMIFLVIVGVFLLVFFCCLQRWWRKLRGKDGKGFMGGKVDLKSVQLLGQAYKEKVQPEMEELTKDMEQNEAGKEEEKEEVKLGRLQFKIDYDFNQSSVSFIDDEDDIYRTIAKSSNIIHVSVPSNTTNKKKKTIQVKYLILFTAWRHRTSSRRIAWFGHVWH